MNTYALAATGALVVVSSFEHASFGQTAPIVNFSELSASAGLTPMIPADGMGTGIAAADYDGDGDIDLYVPTEIGTPNRLYRNSGDGEFTEIAAIAGVDLTTNCRSANWFDADGDGDLDLFVAGDCFGHNYSAACRNARSFHLFIQNTPEEFVDVTVSAGIVQPTILLGSYLGGIAVGDINNDEWLDIYVSYWNGFNSLFLNNGDATFQDISVASGIRAYGNHTCLTPIMVDLNQDGHTDIVQAVDFEPNIFWENLGDNTFVDTAPLYGLANDMNDMGVAIGDFDNDSDLDLYITNVSGSSTYDGHNVLLQNDSNESGLLFTEVAELNGVEIGHWGWGTTFIDYNNNGWLDLGATNGFISFGYDDDPSRFFENNGSGPPWYSDVSTQANFEDTYIGSSVLAVDCDRDGDLDVLHTTMDGQTRLLSSNCTDYPDRHYIVIRPRHSGPNTHAIGAIIRVRAGDLSMMRLITAGTSYLGQEPAEAFFGLDTATHVDELTIEWPSGAIDTYYNIEADRVITVPDDCPYDRDGDSLTTFTELNLVLGNFGTTDAFGDMNHDGTVDIADINLVLGNFGTSCFTTLP